MKKIKGISLLIAILALISCTDKEVQLPVLHHEGIGEIQNHSGIWIFFEVSGNDTLAVMNKNNKLQNTHWIFHIDKRLSMGQLAPLLSAMQEDHDKETMHKKEGMLNYFSFADAVNQRMSLLPFKKTGLTLIDEDAMQGDPRDSCLILLEIRKEGFALDGIPIKAEDIAYNARTCPDTARAKIRLSYSEKLSYGDYLRYKAQLDDLEMITEAQEWMIRKK